MIAIDFVPQNEAAIDALPAPGDGLLLLRDVHRRHFRREFGPIRGHHTGGIDAASDGAVQRIPGVSQGVARFMARRQPRYMVDSRAGHLTIYLPGHHPDALAAKLEATMHQYLHARSLSLGSWQSSRSRQRLSVTPARMTCRYAIERMALALDPEGWEASLSSIHLEQMLSDAIHAAILDAARWEGWDTRDFPGPSSLGITITEFLAETASKQLTDGLRKRVVRRVRFDSSALIEGVIFAGMNVERGYGLLRPAL